MTIHLLKLAIGIKSLQELQEMQQRSAEQLSGHPEPTYAIITRNTPTRINEILEGGSLYWIVKGSIQARQTILDIERLQDDAGRPFCKIILSLAIIRVLPTPHRPIQGWRYFETARIPADLAGIDGEEAQFPDEEMAKQLRELGLL